MEPHEQKLEEVYRLAKENNRMLHAMRRNAFVWGLIKFILYALLLVVIPYFVYTTYLAPMIESTMEAVNQIQGTGAQAQAQFDGLREMFGQFDLSQYLER